MIRRFSHIGINSRDIRKSKEFYCGVFGLREGETVDMEDCILHYVILPDGSSIELFEMKERNFYDGISGDMGTVRHIALETDNVQALYKTVLDRKIPLDMELCAMEALRVRAFICEDPDGVLVEVSQAEGDRNHE